MASDSSYTASFDEMGALFQDYLDGDANRPALALGGRAPSDSVRNALERSFEAFGYEPPTCTYAALIPMDASVEGGDVALDSQALFVLVESLDPLCVIMTDAEAAAALAAAYRTRFPLDAPLRAFGRPAAAFRDLDGLLQTAEGKQKAWGILKTLQRRD